MIGNHFGPVDRTVSVLLDRAYPVVKAVYLRLDSIDKLSKHLDDLEYLATTGYEIIESLDKITSISDAWLKIFEGQGGQEAIDEILKHLDSMEEISPYIEDISKVAPYIQDIITVAEQIKDVSLIYDFYTSVEDVKETKELVNAALEEVQESVEYVQGISWEKIPYVVSTLQEVASYDKDGFFCITGDTEHSDAGDSTWITYPLATEQEAKAGTVNNALMTPLRTRDAIKAMISGNNGLVVKSNGEIVVDFDQMPDEQLENIVLAMVQEGGGLSVDSSGKLYVDFASMPTDKFEDMLKSIRVPIWLTANKNFYVNGETGSDTLDDDRGLSSSKPFKTISACVKYVTDTYNISSYILYITVAPGVYTERLQLGQYSATTGYINLRAQEQGTVTIQNLDDELTIATVSNSTWYIQNFTFDLKLSSANLSSSRLIAAAIHAYTASNVNCQNITLRAINSTEAPATVGQLRLFRCDSGGRLELYQNVSVEFSGFDEESSVQKNILYCGTDAVIALPASGSQYTFSIKGNYGTFLYVTSGTVQIGTNGQPYVYQFSLSSDVPTDGKKFSLINSSKIITNSLGLGYLPGSTAGTIQESTYCFYS